MHKNFTANLKGSILTHAHTPGSMATRRSKNNLELIVRLNWIVIAHITRVSYYKSKAKFTISAKHLPLFELRVLQSSNQKSASSDKNMASPADTDGKDNGSEIYLTAEEVS